MELKIYTQMKEEIKRILPTGSHHTEVEVKWSKYD